LSDGKETFLVGRSVTINADPKYWENKTLTQLNKDAVRAVTVTDPNGREVIACAREKEGEDFTVAGKSTEDLNQYELKNLAGLGESLTFINRLPMDDKDAATALAKPYSIELHTFTGGTLRLKIGGLGTGDQVRAFVRLSPEGEVKGVHSALITTIQEQWQFEVPKYLLERVRRGKQEYVAKKS
jgi:hypothetical protein